MERLVFDYEDKVYVLPDGRFIPNVGAYKFPGSFLVDVTDTTPSQLEKLVAGYKPETTRRHRPRFYHLFSDRHMGKLHTLTFIDGNPKSNTDVINEVNERRMRRYNEVVNG